MHKVERRLRLKAEQIVHLLPLMEQAARESRTFPLQQVRGLVRSASGQRVFGNVNRVHIVEFADGDFLCVKKYSEDRIRRGEAHALEVLRGFSVPRVILQGEGFIIKTYEPGIIASQHSLDRNKLLQLTYEAGRIHGHLDSEFRLPIEGTDHEQKIRLRLDVIAQATSLDCSAIYETLMQFARMFDSRTTVLDFDIDLDNIALLSPSQQPFFFDCEIRKEVPDCYIVAGHIYFSTQQLYHRLFLELTMAWARGFNDISPNPVFVDGDFLKGVKKAGFFRTLLTVGSRLRRLADLGKEDAQWALGAERGEMITKLKAQVFGRLQTALNLAEEVAPSLSPKLHEIQRVLEISLN